MLGYAIAIIAAAIGFALMLGHSLLPAMHMVGGMLR